MVLRSRDLDGHGLHDDRLVAHEEGETAGVFGLERGGHVRQRADRHDDRGVGALVAQVRPVRDGDPVRRHALGGNLRSGVLFEGPGGLRQGVEALGGQRRLDGLLAHGDDVGQPDPVRGQHAGQRVDEHPGHAQRVGHRAGVLPARAAEHVQHVLGHVVAALHRDLLDRVGHVRHGDLGEAGRDLLRAAGVAGVRGDLITEFRKFRFRNIRVEGLVALLAEDPREVVRLDAAEQHVGVGDGERAAAPVAGGAGVGAGRVGPGPVPAPVEVQDGAAARGHGVDGQHRGAHPHPGDLRLVLALELAREVRHVGGGAAHVEADGLGEARVRGRAGHADDPAGRTGHDRVLAAEARRVGQPAVGLHEQQPDVLQLGRDLGHVALQDGRQVGVHHRGVAPGDQLHQRAGPVRLRHLGEAGRAGEVADPRLVLRVAVAVHADHGGGPVPVLAGPGQLRGESGLVERGEDLAASGDPLVRLDDAVVEHLGEQDAAVEDPRPVLVGDAQRVAEAPGDDQDGGLALPLQQGVGGDGGAEPDRADLAGRDVLTRLQAEQLPDAGHRGVFVGFRAVGEQLAGDQPAVRAAGHDVGERAAPVDPEFPALLVVHVAASPARSA